VSGFDDRTGVVSGAIVDPLHRAGERQKPIAIP
jgi:hypothetical protein